MTNDELATRLSLIQQMKDGAEKAWPRFCERYGRLLSGCCRRAGLRPEDAEDVVQDALLRIFQYIQTFDKEASKPGQFRCWLRTITMHLASNWRRRRKEALDPQAVEQACEEVERDFARLWKEDLLRYAADKVSPLFSDEAWRAFCQVHINERPREEVARELNRAPGWVSTTTLRVRQAIREFLIREFGRAFLEEIGLLGPPGADPDTSQEPGAGHSQRGAS
jgi:RNA polymerase sigma-70 factor, ECF subfamily